MADVLKHISFARNWLNKAEDKFKTNESSDSDSVEGELFLSLAEAEVHKAWEKSVSTHSRKTNSFFAKLKKISTGKIALVLVLVLVLIFTSFGYYKLSGNKSSFELSLQNSKEYAENNFEEKVGFNDISITLNQSQNK